MQSNTLQHHCRSKISKCSFIQHRALSTCQQNVVQDLQAKRFNCQGRLWLSCSTTSHQQRSTVCVKLSPSLTCSRGHMCKMTSWVSSFKLQRISLTNYRFIVRFVSTSRVCKDHKRNQNANKLQDIAKSNQRQKKTEYQGQQTKQVDI